MLTIICLVRAKVSIKLKKAVPKPPALQSAGGFVFLVAVLFNAESYLTLLGRGFLANLGESMGSDSIDPPFLANLPLSKKLGQVLSFAF